MSKPRNYEDEPDDVQIIGLGSYQSSPRSGKVKTQAIGFIRPKKKDDVTRKTKTVARKRSAGLQVARKRNK